MMSINQQPQARIVIGTRGYSLDLSKDCIQRLTRTFNTQYPEAGFTEVEIRAAFVYNIISTKIGRICLEPERAKYVDYRIYFRSHPFLLKIVDECGLFTIGRHLDFCEVSENLRECCYIKNNNGAESVGCDLEHLIKRRVPLDPENLSREEAIQILKLQRTLLNYEG